MKKKQENELVGIRVRKGLKDEVKNLGGNPSRIAEKAFEDFISRMKAKSGSSGARESQTNSGDNKSISLQTSNKETILGGGTQARVKGGRLCICNPVW